MGTVSYDFDGETVIVTGGSSGIGRSMALRFADAGATVLVADIRADPKAEGEDQPTHERINDEGGAAAYVETDVSNPDEVRTLVSRAREHGGVDVMMNNAGLQHPAPFTEVEPGALDQLHGVNVRGTFVGTQVAANDMIDRRDPGAIVNTASISSSFAQHDQVQYDATKGAIRMITRGGALELASEDIRVNAVAPGQIATEFTEGWATEAEAAIEEGGFIKPVPQGRVGYPDDVAEAALFLASDAAGYITGELLYVDGGWHVF